MDNADKHVDESWKESVDKEKKISDKGDDYTPPQPDFSLFVTSMALQASISLGEVANPTNGKKEENLPQAKFLIDTLDMIKDKTAGNLQPEEVKLIEGVLYELHLQYVEKTKKV